VAIGVGASGLPLDGGVIAAALLGVTVAACLWWSDFDWVVYVAQARLAQATGAQRAALARDLYSYRHLSMVGGIVLFAFGLKTTLADVSSSLVSVAALGLVGGVALYLLAHVALRLRIGGGLGRGRPAATVVLLGLLPVVSEIPALTALALVAAVCVSPDRLRSPPVPGGARLDPQPARRVHHGRGRPFRKKPPEEPPSSSWREMSLEIRPKQPTTKGPADLFTGDIWFDVIAKGEEPSRIRVNAVRFSPGARPAWQ
jgi:hypothetical protein